MDALSNARITEEIIGEGVAPFTPPKAKNLQSGVSVEYVHDPKKRWFVLRALYGKADKAADMLIEAGYYAYIAKRYEDRIVNGRRKRGLKNLIPNILFTYIEKDEIASLLSRKSDAPSPLPKLAQTATFYYNHFATENGKNPPLQVHERQMMDFIMITATNDDNMVYVNDSKIVHIKNDDLVYVKQGKFKGCMGQVVRVAGQQRVGLRLAELGWVATSYVPTAFLEVIPKELYDSHVETLAKQ